MVDISRLLFSLLNAAHQHVPASFVFRFRNVDICTDLPFNLLNIYILFAFHKGHFKGHFDHYRLGRFGHDDCTMYTHCLRCMAWIALTNKMAETCVSYASARVSMSKICNRYLAKMDIWYNI